jgi:hypothetical protein
MTIPLISQCWCEVDVVTRDNAEGGIDDSYLWEREPRGERKIGQCLYSRDLVFVIVAEDVLGNRRPGRKG